MAAAIGCSERASTAATSARTSARSKPFATTRSVSSGRPSVSVPVLSSATTSASRSVCRASPLRNRTPISAARPVPTMIEVGVARPMAQGQAMISTATALTRAKARAGSGPKSSQTRKVTAAAAITAGTNHCGHLVDERLDRQLAALRLLDHADDLRQHRVGADLRRRGSVKLPVPLIVPPMTAAPSAFCDGHGLARDHGLVDEGRALDDRPVDRDPFARTHLDPVADDDGAEIGISTRPPVALDPRGLRLEADEALDRLARASLGPRLETAVRAGSASRSPRPPRSRRSPSRPAGPPGRKVATTE